jgi:hypothetical protein
MAAALDRFWRASGDCRGKYDLSQQYVSDLIARVGNDRDDITEWPKNSERPRQRFRNSGSFTPIGFTLWPIRRMPTEARGGITGQTCATCSPLDWRALSSRS